VRRCFLRVKRFEDFQGRRGVTRHVLADRLKKLVRHGLLREFPTRLSPKRYKYLLTPKGLDPYPIVMAIVHSADIHMVDESGRPRLTSATRLFWVPATAVREKCAYRPGAMKAIYVRWARSPSGVWNVDF